VVQESGKAAKWPQGITFQILACRPKSRGSVRLNSASITDKPVIDLGYLTDSAGADARSLREGLRISRKLASTSAWSSILAGEAHPGPSKTSDEQLDDFIGKTIHSGNALTGTCALGPKGTGVVSPTDLSVYGVRGLRVVDSSVIPMIPGGQTGAPTVMIAERAAAMLTQATVSMSAPELALH
jgi:choline dehydrogenase-like flavoprotein